MQVALFSLVASALAEADPYWTPAVYTPSGLVAHANGALVPDYTPAQKAVAAQHFALKYGKREAEAEPYYGYGYGLPYFGYGKSGRYFATKSPQIYEMKFYFFLFMEKKCCSKDTV